MEETQDYLVIFWDGNKAFYEKVYDTKPEEAPEKAINSLLMVKEFDPDYDIASNSDKAGNKGLKELFLE